MIQTPSVNKAGIAPARRRQKPLAKSLDELFAEGEQLRRKLRQKHKAHRTIEERAMRFVVR